MSFFFPRLKPRTSSTHKQSTPTSTSSTTPKSDSNAASIESALQIIKQIGERHTDEKRSFDPKRLDADIRSLVSLMKRHRSEKHLQRVACHTISNLAIQQEKCPIICAQSAHKYVLRAVTDNMDDWKMCWLAMSAIWNMARPESCRKLFDCVSTLKLIYKVLHKHTNIHLVVETAVGALSNLVLHERVRAQCGKFHVLEFLIRIIQIHAKQCNVATASAGLITNLAHSNDIASRLAEIGTIPLVVNLMSEHSHDTHLQRNCCAALSNMSSSSGYVHNLVECLGIERLFASLNLAALNPASQIEPLAEQALFIIDIDWTKIRMNSVHIAAKKGLYHSVYKCVSLMTQYQRTEQKSDVAGGYHEHINVADSKGNTPLHYSIEHQHENVTKLLVSRGSDVSIVNKEGKTPLDLIKETKMDGQATNGMLIAVQNGLTALKTARKAMNRVLCEVNVAAGWRQEKEEEEETDDDAMEVDSDEEEEECEDGEVLMLPMEIGGIIVEYIDAFEVMDFYGHDEFSKNHDKVSQNSECLTSHYVMADHETA